ncbi:MAG: tRNA (adenosine(37)-N6)-threonylcarbamoyltransferase complex ATPase subunit type 1 TsaE [Bacillota bacterium]|nr:tRNA (adenosine(37)-N6)-threonylcarbamoyltransferase complex ATPase subunit type 1 TsaE [Bacillota bacterium]
MIYNSFSEAETEALGEKLAEEYKGSPTFLLYGDLGAGKTALTRGLVKGYGSSDLVSSPTFTIVHEYDGEKTVYHFDLYRLMDEEELDDIGFEDYFKEGTVRIIEWPDSFSQMMPKDSIKVKIARGEKDNERVIEVIG